VTTPHCCLELFLPGTGVGSLDVTEFVYVGFTEFVYHVQKWRILKTISALDIRPVAKLRGMILDESGGALSDHSLPRIAPSRRVTLPRLANFAMFFSHKEHL
jgi:hypothetical protein